MPVYSRPPPASGLRKKWSGVAHGFAQQDAVGAGPAGAYEEGAHVLEGQGAAHDGFHLLADLDVLPVARDAAPGRFVQHLPVDGLQFLRFVVVAAGDVGVLAPLPGCPPLVTGTPADDPGQKLVPLVGVYGLDVLDDQGGRVAALLLLHVQHPLDAVDGVAGAQHAEELPVVAGEEAVDAGQPPAGAARPVAHVGSAGMADDGAVLGIGGVLLVAEQGIGVADAVGEVDERPQGGVAGELLGAEAHPNHVLGLFDGLAGDVLNFGKCLDYLLLLHESFRLPQFSANA